MTKLGVLSIGLFVTSAARAQVTATVDLLSPGEPGYDALPVGVAVVDCFVDVGATDTWTAGAMRVETFNTATFVYAHDLSGDIILVNPGLGQQYTTFLSRPRARHVAERFENGAAGIGGEPDASPTLFSAVWLAQPAAPGTPGDGYVARVAVNLGDFSDRRDDLQLSLTPPDPSFPALASSTSPDGFAGWLNASFDHPALSGINWYLFDPVPEPASGVGFLAGACLLLHFARRFH